MSAETLVIRFWAKVDRSGECWLWKAAVSGDGYGAFWRDGRLQRAHRVAFEIANGSLPADKQVLHRCDTPLCVRPDHLFAGTIGENMRDMVAKGRASNGWATRTAGNPGKDLPAASAPLSRGER